MKKSIELVKKTYLLTKMLPSDDKFVLVAQMRRAVISIPSTIAEGAGINRPGINSFLVIGLGSLMNWKPSSLFVKNSDIS